MTSQKSEYPKVLVAIPTYEGKDYILRQCINCVRNFNYPNFEYIIIDNTKDMRYFLKLRREGFKNELRHVDRGGNSRQALCNAQNLARQKCLDESFDYLLFVECDLLPPPNTIQRLISHNVPVVGVLYLLGTGAVKKPCIFLKEYKKEQLCMGTRLLNPDEYDSYYNKGLKKVHGTGLGTTLIRRDIVSRFIFWYDERFTEKHSDVYWYMDLDNNGIPCYCDTDFMIEHIPSKWELVKDR